MIHRCVLLASSVALVTFHVTGAVDATSLNATSDLWGTTPREYRTAVFSALSVARQMSNCDDIMCEWFTNMVAYVCPETSFEDWAREKTLMIGVGTRISAIASSSACWYSTAECYAGFKEQRNVLAEDSTRATRFAFLTNANATAYYSALEDNKRRMNSLRAVDAALASISNAVLATFPAAILRGGYRFLLQSDFCWRSDGSLLLRKSSDRSHYHLYRARSAPLCPVPAHR